MSSGESTKAFLILWTFGPQEPLLTLGPTVNPCEDDNKDGLGSGSAEAAECDVFFFHSDSPPFLWESYSATYRPVFDTDH